MSEPIISEAWNSFSIFVFYLWVHKLARIVIAGVINEVIKMVYPEYFLRTTGPRQCDEAASVREPLREGGKYYIFYIYECRTH